MTSARPKTNLGKQRASQNAVRHGLTAETVLVPLEDPDDYQAFEQAVTADYEAETAVQTDWTPAVGPKAPRGIDLRRQCSCHS